MSAGAAIYISMRLGMVGTERKAAERRAPGCATKHSTPDPFVYPLCASAGWFGRQNRLYETNRVRFEKLTRWQPSLRKYNRAPAAMPTRSRPALALYCTPSRAPPAWCNSTLMLPLPSLCFCECHFLITLHCSLFNEHPFLQPLQPWWGRPARRRVCQGASHRGAFPGGVHSPPVRRPA